jgi:hypothetical protein
MSPAPPAPVHTLARGSVPRPAPPRGWASAQQFSATSARMSLHLAASSACARPAPASGRARAPRPGRSQRLRCRSPRQGLDLELAPNPARASAPCRTPAPVRPARSPAHPLPHARTTSFTAPHYPAHPLSSSRTASFTAPARLLRSAPARIARLLPPCPAPAARRTGCAASLQRSALTRPPAVASPRLFLRLSAYGGASFSPSSAKPRRLLPSGGSCGCESSR